MKLGLIPWTRIGIGVGILAGVLLVGLWQGAERRADKLQRQVIKWQTAYGKLEAAGKAAQAENAKVITRWRTRTVEVDRNARAVEDAPLLGGCRTPQAVTDAVE